MKFLSARLIVFVIVAAILSGCSAKTPNPEDVVEGAPAPDFSLTALNGATFRNRSLKGNVVVLNFWATWCVPCQSEMPVLNEIAANPQVKVVGIALDEGGAKVVQPYVDAHSINYQILIGNQEVFEQFNGIGIPYTLVLDRTQRIVKIYRGPITKEDLEKVLKSMA